MRLLRVNYFIVFVMLLFSSLSATQLKLEITNNGQGRAGAQTVSVGTPFEVTVSITDGDRNTGTLELETTDQVKIVGSSRSTNVEMVNGNYSSQTAYIFQLHALAEGEIKLGPAHLRQGSETFNSNILELKATKAAEQPQASVPQATDNAAVLCRLTANKKTALIGEPITAKVTVLSRGQILQVSMEPPKFPGFIVKEIQNVSRRQETFNGAQYNVIEKSYVIIPSEQGTKSIEPVKVAFAVPVKQKSRHQGLFEDAFFAGFFDQARIEQKTTLSNALPLTINPLPENQGQIEGVGEFNSFTAHINKKEAHVNEALTLKLEVTGQGNLDQIVTPKLILPAFMKAYDSKSTIKEDLASDYHGGKKTFEYVIQIAQEGDAEIPSQEFTYFDTVSKATRTIKTPPISVHLTPAPQTLQSKINHVKTTEDIEEDPAIAQPQPEKKKKQDISFIQEDGPIMLRTNGGLNFFFLFLLLLLIAAVIFGNLFILTIKTMIFPQLFKNRLYKKKLALLNNEFSALQHHKQVDKLYQFFVKFLAIKCNVEIEAITHDWLQEYLSKNQWEETKINHFFDFLNECAGCHFVSNSTQPTVDHEELFKKGSYWLLLLSK